MKRVVLLSLTCLALLLTIGVISILASPYAQAGRGIQMLSGTFNDQDLPGGNGQTKVTLITIPFSVSATTSKLAATSLINAYQPNVTFAASVLCELDVDNVSFFTNQTSLSNLSSYTGVSGSVGVTSTITGIAPGSHIFAVKCAGFSGNNGPGIPVHSLGTSVIITG
jgi:hypothetical protein